MAEHENELNQLEEEKEQLHNEMVQTINLNHCVTQNLSLG